MKSRMLCLIVPVIVLASQPSKADLVFDFGFNSGFEGWTTPDTNVTRENSGGNPDGYIRKDDNGSTPDDNDWLYAPSSILGDWTSYDDVANISFDHKLFEIGDEPTFFPYELFIQGPTDSASWVGDTASDVTPWLTVSASLRESDWIVSGNWFNLLSNVTEFRVRIETVGNVSIGDVTGLDNIRMTTVPEPSAIIFLAFGLAQIGFCRPTRCRTTL